MNEPFIVEWQVHKMHASLTLPTLVLDFVRECCTLHEWVLAFKSRVVFQVLKHFVSSFYQIFLQFILSNSSNFIKIKMKRETY